jgi:hypothetical protein
MYVPAEAATSKVLYIAVCLIIYNIMHVVLKLCVQCFIPGPETCLDSITYKSNMIHCYIQQRS